MSKKWKELEEILHKDIVDDEIVGGEPKRTPNKTKESEIPFDTVFEIQDEKIKKILEMSDSLRLNYTRDHRYDRLGEIQDDPEFKGILHIFADEVNTIDEDGKKFGVFCSSQRVVEIIKRLYERIGLENKSWEITKNMCGFGDEFYEIVYAKDFSKILKILKLPRGLIERVERRGELQHFKLRKDYMSTAKRNENGLGIVEYEYNNFISNVNKKEEIIEPYRILHFKIDSDKNYPYGESIFEGMLSAIEEYRLMRQAMLINRITRAPERRIFKINVGQAHGEKGIQYAKDIVSQFKNRKVIDQATPNKSAKKERNFISASEDIVLPYRQGDEPHGIDTLPGLTQTPTEDTEFFRDRIYPGVGVSRTYLNDDTFQNTNMNLSNKDIKFARKIQRTQKFIIYQAYKLALIELRLHKIPKKEYEDLIITMNNPSTILEEQRIQIQTNKWNLIQSIKANNTEKVFVNDFYIYENIMGLSKEEILQMMLLNKAQEKNKNPFYYLPEAERPIGYDLLNEFFDNEEIQGGGETVDDAEQQDQLGNALDDAGITPEEPTNEIPEPEEEPQLASYQVTDSRKTILTEAQKRAYELKKKFLEKVEKKENYDAKLDKKKKFTKVNYTLEYYSINSEFKGLQGGMRGEKKKA